LVLPLEGGSGSPGPTFASRATDAGPSPSQQLNA